MVHNLVFSTVTEMNTQLEIFVTLQKAETDLFQAWFGNHDLTWLEQIIVWLDLK